MSSPTLKRRRLSIELRRLRQAADLSVTEAAKRLDLDPATITRMERNDWKRPNINIIRNMLTLYGVTDDANREALLNLARESRKRGWWADYADVFRSSLPDFESGARAIFDYQTILVPGLLQTADYARAIFRGSQVLRDEPVIERHVEARLNRQAILDRDQPFHYWSIIDEAGLTKLVGGPEVMREQLQHLCKMAAKPNITVQVLLDGAGAHAAMMGAFAILDFPSPNDPSMVYIETATDALYLEKPEELHRYRLIYSHIQSVALTPEESVRHIASLADRL